MDKVRKQQQQIITFELQPLLKLLFFKVFIA